MEPFRLYGSVHRATVPSANSLTLPATLPAVLLATPGARVTGATGSAPPTVPSTDTVAESPPAAIPADPYTVLRITLVLEAPRRAYAESSQNPFRRMHVRYVA